MSDKVGRGDSRADAAGREIVESDVAGRQISGCDAAGRAIFESDVAGREIVVFNTGERWPSSTPESIVVAVVADGAEGDDG